MGVWIKKRLDCGPLERSELRASLEDIGGDIRIEIACPGCGKPSTLDRDIAPNGAVIGVWPCPNEACPCSEYLQLESWNE